jgi:heavy metal translocating P-type ATPase
MSRSPYLFDEFFASGQDETISPFLTPDSRKWGKHLSLKSSLFSAFLLAIAFGLSFFHKEASYLFLFPVYFLVGTPAFIDSLEDLKNLEINIDVLMTLAALFSVLIGSAIEGALLLVLFELSAAMEESVSRKTKSTLLQLHELSPRTAFVIEGDHVVEKSIKEIPLNTHLLIKAGEIIPLDGEVISGSSFINLVHLTGESLPVAKKPGDEVQAGSLNLDGTLTVKVTRTSHDSTLSRIIQLITAAQEAKPKLERFLDRFGKWYASTIILLFLFFALTLPLFLSIPYLGKEGGIYRALTFLIAASPCALIIATPTAYLSAISSCARKGILLKGGVILDALAKSQVIALDKTGTLTTGKLTFVSLDPIGKSTFSEDEALSIAASLERHVVHPIAEAITKQAEEKKLSLVALSNFKSTAGSGLEAMISWQGKNIPVFIGHEDFIIPRVPSEKKKQAKELSRKEGHLSTFLLIGDELFVFHFKDELKANIQQTINILQNEEKLRVIMLTGDHEDNARGVAKSLGIHEFFADLRPEDKLAHVSRLSSQKGLIMVGDGINDAPALARSTVGISMGKVGSATAVDASDIVLLHDDLNLIPWVKRKAHQTMSIIKQNLSLALLVILCATTPALLGIVPLWVAVLLHEGGTVLVGLNSLRLLKSSH